VAGEERNDRSFVVVVGFIAAHATVLCFRASYDK
jgi:hypothetical protein